MITEKASEIKEYPGFLKTNIDGMNVTEGSLWTASQRKMNPVHYSISYRASFKPELPAFFINKYLKEEGISGGRILDPFGGRGTTVMQANISGYSGDHNDMNPVSVFLAKSRQFIPHFKQVAARLESLELNRRTFILEKSENDKLSPFFHPDTIQEIMNLREIMLSDEGKKDPEIQYIGLTALSRLYGHSTGFLSVYTFPQISIMPKYQEKNNLKRNVIPEYRPLKPRILQKLKRDLAEGVDLTYYNAAMRNRYFSHDARDMHSIDTGSIDLIITSPPFLDKVDYLQDNWMRAWFLGLEEETENLSLSVYSDLREWIRFMRDTIYEAGRTLKVGGRMVIEVGEVEYKKSIHHLEEEMLRLLPIKTEGGMLVGEEIYLNSQKFTKLSNCWEVDNNSKGTNTNRCLVIKKIQN
jgi:hypothetical protein